MEDRCNFLTAVENIQIGESLAVAVTLVMEDGEPTLVIGRVFGANGIEMYRTQRDASGHYRDAILGVLDEMRQQWATNQSL